MANDNEILNARVKYEDYSFESFDLDDLEEKLQSQLQEDLIDMKFLAEEKEKIGNPDNLGNVIMDVVWEQFLNQVAVTAGEDFIKENKGLTLDLGNEAHIQSTENFANGKLASHNTKIDYQERYDDWQSNFKKDENGYVVTHPTRNGKTEATLVKGARKPFDYNRPNGSAEKNTDMDHTVSAGEIIRDPVANAHMTKEEQISFANSDANLYEMNSSLNRSKGDKSTTEWLDNPNAKGQKPNEIFDISDEEDKKMRQKDVEAREEYDKQKKDGVQKSLEMGKKSQKEEAFRIGGYALRGVITQLLAELVKEIIAKLVKWFKATKKGLDSLFDGLKDALHSFWRKMKTHLINAGSTIFNTVVSAIIGPVFGTIKKTWMLLKQGWKSLKDAVNYIKNPDNKGMPIGRLLLETGKIIIAGLTGAGSLLLGEVIEKGLMTIPIFAIEIPWLGSLANILGIFFGAVVSGIIGAIAINIIEKQVEKNLRMENINAQMNKGNETLNLQHKVQIVNEMKLVQTKVTVATDIYDRHVAAATVMAESVNNIKENCSIDKSIENTFDEIDMLFARLKD